MTLTAFPTILFNTSGSDSAASGAGPATAITGTCLASTASTTVSFDGAPDLSGVAQDGSAVLWLNGIGFVRISTVDNSAKTCVVETALTVGAGTAFAIGGKRATLNDTESRRLFLATASPTASGASGRWIVRLENGQTTTSSITLSFTAGSGQLVIEGDSATTRRVWTVATNSARHVSCTAVNRVRFQNLHFLNSHATPLYVYTTISSSHVEFVNCVIGSADGVNCPQGACVNTAEAPSATFVNTAVLRCKSHGVFGTNGSFGVVSQGSEFSRCGGRGIYNNSVATAFTLLTDTIISHNASAGVEMPGASWLVMDRCTVANNGGDGIRLTGNTLGWTTDSGPRRAVIITNSQITANSGYGINCTGTVPHFPGVEYCNFGNASDSTVNASGSVNCFTLSGTNTTIAPGYTDSSVGVRNYGLAVTAQGTGMPSAATIGAGQSGSTSSVSIGAVQPQPSATGPIIRRVLRGSVIGGLLR